MTSSDWITMLGICASIIFSMVALIWKAGGWASETRVELASLKLAINNMAATLDLDIQKLWTAIGKRPTKAM